MAWQVDGGIASIAQSSRAASAVRPHRALQQRGGPEGELASRAALDCTSLVAPPTVESL